MDDKILNQTSCCESTPSEIIGCDCSSTGSSCCESGPVPTNGKDVPCPICGKTGVPVENEKVKHM